MENTKRNPEIFRRARGFIDLEPGVELLNVGSSIGAYDIDYAPFAVRAANLALAPQSQAGSFRIIRQYAARLKKHASILIPVSPFDCCLDTVKPELLEREYAYLSPELIPNYSPEKAARIQEFLNKNPLSASSEPPPPPTQMTLHQMEQHAEMILREWWMLPFGIQDLRAPLPSSCRESFLRGAQTMREMLAFCRDREFRTILLLCPLSEPLMRLFPSEFEQHYIRDFLDTFREGSDALLDFMTRKEWQNPSLFADSFFLNAAGREKFTAALLSESGFLQTSDKGDYHAI